jgi:hypothetical protein
VDAAASGVDAESRVAVALTAVEGSSSTGSLLVTMVEQDTRTNIKTREAIENEIVLMTRNTSGL